MSRLLPRTILRSSRQLSSTLKNPAKSANRLQYSTSSPALTPSPSTTKFSSTTKPSPSFPTTPSCPSPTCACPSMPSFPPGFEIDHDKPLNGTMAPYAEQVLICTGKDDWSSNLTDEEGGENLAAGIKGLVGRGGEFVDPYHNILVTNASFRSTGKDEDEKATSAYLFPSFKYISSVPHTPTGIQTLVKGHLLPQSLHPMNASLSPEDKSRLTRDSSLGKQLEVEDVKEVLVLICGHGGRDIRCGILGPLLRDQFRTVFAQSQSEIAASLRDSKVGLISHIGGHKFAGNVIIYIPPDWKKTDGQVSELAGMGVWYGRVEPKHVEGIVKETLEEGRVIEEFFRGRVRQGGEVLRI